MSDTDMDTINVLASALTRATDDLENKGGHRALTIIQKALRHLETAKCSKCKGKGFEERIMGFYRGCVEKVYCTNCEGTGKKYKRKDNKWSAY